MIAEKEIDEFCEYMARNIEELEYGSEDIEHIDLLMRTWLGCRIVLSEKRISMSKKERIEDLGKLAIILKDVCDDEVFNVFQGKAAKFSYDVFNKLNDEQKIDFIEQISYGLRKVHDIIYECKEIAEGDYE